jgi:hypothetical protein
MIPGYEYLAVTDGIIPAQLFSDKILLSSKFALHEFNIIKTSVPTVILIDGAGYRPAALKFLKDEVADAKALRGVWTMAEFHMEINNGFLG